MARSLRRAAGIGLALFVGLSVVSCGKRTETPPGPAMWHLSDADSDIYLFGTFHMLPAKLDWERPNMVKAFDNSSILILEADVQGAAPGDVVNLIKKYGIAPADAPLRSRLTPDQLAQYEKVAAALGLDPAVLDPYQPWYASTVLSVKYAEKHGYSPAEGADEKLVKAAETETKPLAYLETVQQQIGFLASLPTDTQTEMFVATLNELSTDDQTLPSMQAAWMKGDTRAMAGLFDQSVKAVPDLYKTLVIDRNKRWADEIQKLMAGSGKVFIAVGAGHLVGSDGVVALLRQRGFKVDGP
jgi:uncharacterized protein